LYKKLISKVGEQLFEKIHFNFKIPILLKDEYKDITLKYQEVFDIENNFNENNTLETPLYNYDSIEEAIQKLNSLQFINYLTEKKPSPSQINMINRINIQNFNHFSLNLILNYSFEKNGKIVNAFVEKIANDFISRNIFSFEEVEKELENAKNNSPKTNVEIEKTPNINKK
jgi:replication initiation and membrane attachment protein